MAVYLRGARDGVFIVASADPEPLSIFFFTRRRDRRPGEIDVFVSAEPKALALGEQLFVVVQDSRVS
ncbi:MAG: hypothetical protein ACREQB_07060 [Candidatus Binataceae bacterium]